ncbi:hypothetical protein EON80_26230 [bacterium]|nr:MAG: hypothetical protein EON80_26230 [bacterium]
MKDLSKLALVKPNQGRARWVERQFTGMTQGWTTRLLLLAGTALLTACGVSASQHGKPFLNASGQIERAPIEIAAPQVAYRIDEHRFFEIVPSGPGACTNAMVYFVDKAKGIRSEAVRLDPGSMGAGTLIIDAANDQYLVAPVTRGNLDCSSGGGYCAGPKLPYSVDGGRTWKRGNPRFTNGFDLYLTGEDLFYAGQKVKLSSMTLGDSAWQRYYILPSNPLPTLKVLPSSTKFHCIPNGKE